MKLPDTPPTHAEIEDQLTLMRASARFRSASNPSDFLEVAVRRALDGKKTAARDIANTLFKGKFVAGDSDVRVTASSLRKVLELYYDQEGREDLVRIWLPEPSKDKRIKPVEGEAYTPQFSYNSAYWLVLGLRLGYLSLARWSYTQHLRAYSIFAELLEQEPDHVGPTLGLIETFCAFEYRGWNNPMRPDWYAYSRTALNRLKKSSPGYWRLWAVRGYLHSVHNEKDKAAAAFKESLALNRAETELFLPYITFLIETGQDNYAFTLGNRYMDLHLEDGIAVAQFAMFLVYLGRVDAAIEHLEQSLLINAGSGAAHELLAMVYLPRNDFDKAIKHVLILKTLYDETSFEVALECLERFEEKLGLEKKIKAAVGLEVNGPGHGIAKR